jgi:hypothetical protein
MTPDDSTRVVGKVVSVQADNIVVELLSGTDNFTIAGFDDVHYIARLGSFLIIPTQTQYVVAEVVGLREKEATRRDQSGDSHSRESGSTKYLDLVPVGMLSKRTDGGFKFGVSLFPSLYADALYALDDELDRIFETANPTDQVPDQPDGTKPNPEDASWFKSMPIGTSVVFQDYEVKIRIDEFFGGHAAVLGNTGSGKSCTVSAILQSLFSKVDQYKAIGSTFVILDVNGEYTPALSSLANHGIGVQTLVLDGTHDTGKFQLPHWFLNLSEWELLLQASEKTQLPVLRNALGLTGLQQTSDARSRTIKKHIVAKCVVECFSQGDSPVSRMQRVVSLLRNYGTPELNYDTLRRYRANEKYGNFDAVTGQQDFLTEVSSHLVEDAVIPPYSHIPFTFSDLELALDIALLYEEAHGNHQIRDYCSQMVTRFKSLRDNGDYNFLKLSPENTHNTVCDNESSFICQLFGLERGLHQTYYKTHQIIVLDMNSVEDDVVELVSSVVARMAFKILRHAETRNTYPVHLILEEAHRYIAERPTTHSIDASKIFERIAKEGRKYGLFLHLASQRPSELSKTVLSQCSNFIIHRIQNPDDLSHIRQMTPFISEAVLRRLPSLPKQHALVFGNSVNLPTTFKVRTASPTPKSGDAAIRELWFHPQEQPAAIDLPRR